MTRREAEWDDSERAWALALVEVEADACPGCGQPLSETTRPEADGEYEVPLPTRCHACTPLAARQREYAESPPGLLYQVKRR